MLILNDMNFIMRRKAVLATAAAVMMLAAGCGGSEEKKEAEQLGPEETVEAFCRVMAAGGFEDAMALCDTMTMKGYIETYAEAWEMQVKADSSATVIAASLLADAEFIVEDAVKEGDRRHILYIMDAGNGLKKEKKATVRKIEGVWKVEEITDRI